ncbi:hypothetical protein ZOSMA_44G00690 [Zostera marina]|uniref:Uncharacterized protein n=1 Tax=Zostera marina TaxID=29655 RepID=A0A0K9P125_ZOSMR|nr:hypothetical protein ZOSMA_44G00690 [Zostera marina]
MTGCSGAGGMVPAQKDLENKYGGITPKKSLISKQENLNNEKTRTAMVSLVQKLQATTPHQRLPPRNPTCNNH